MPVLVELLSLLALIGIFYFPALVVISSDIQIVRTHANIKVEALKIAATVGIGFWAFILFAIQN